MLVHKRPMLTHLEALASDIADLTKACDDLEGTEAAVLLRQMVTHLEVALYDLAERPGMLVGDMPWWVSRNGEGDPS